MTRQETKHTGRPPVSDTQREWLLRKLEPYLKSGLSIHKACLQAQIPKSTVYDLIQENDDFAEKIDVFKGYISVLVSETISKEVIRISSHCKHKQPIKNQDMKFIQWVALNSNSCVELFGRREDILMRDYDPVAEIRRINKLIDETIDKEVEDKQATECI